MTARRTPAIVVMAAVIVCVALAGTALASYRAQLSGSRTATATAAAAPQAVTITTNSTAAALLQPGGTGDLVLTVTNPNAYSVQLTGLSLGAVTGCSSPGLSLTSSTGYLPVTIPASASGLRVVLAGALSMAASASSDCQNKTLTIALTPTVHE